MSFVFPSELVFSQQHGMRNTSDWSQTAVAPVTIQTSGICCLSQASAPENDLYFQPGRLQRESCVTVHLRLMALCVKSIWPVSSPHTYAVYTSVLTAPLLSFIPSDSAEGNKQLLQRGRAESFSRVARPLETSKTGGCVST